MNESGKTIRSAEEWEMSRSCQRTMFSSPTSGVGPDEAGQARDPLGADRILLVGHGRGPLLALGERLLELEDLGPLEVADLDGELFDGGGEKGQGREDLGMAVPLQDLGRDLGRLELELLEGHDLDARVEMDERPHRAGDAADGDRPQGLLQSADVPADLLVPDEELEPESHRLGVDAVGPADADGQAMLQRLALEETTEGAEVDEEIFERFLDEERQGRVDDVVGGQAEMDVARVRPDLFGDRGQEGDDVVLDDLLDGVDPVDRESGLGLDRPQGGTGNLSQPGPGFADGQLDVQPLAVPVLFGPDGAHGGAGVAFDHSVSAFRGRTG